MFYSIGMLGKLFIVLILVVGIVGTSGAAVADDIVLLFNDAGYMPFFSNEYGTNKGQFAGKGMFVDFLDAFEAAYPRHSIKRVLVPRRRANRMIEVGAADGFALQSPLFFNDPGGHYRFSQPIWQTGDYVYVLRKGEGGEPCAGTREALFGKKVGLISGYGYGPLEAWLREGDITESRVRTHEQLYRLLLNGRVDAIVDSMHVLPYNFGVLALDYLRVQACPPPLYAFGLSVVLHESKAQFIRDLNNFIRESKTNGLLRRIEEKWIGGAGTLPPLR